VESGSVRRAKPALICHQERNPHRNPDLLSLYVNPDFLRGDLHRDGGFVFFLLALLLLWPIFAYLERSERPSTVSPVPEGGN
jgi:hypothetical protein